MLNHKKTPFDTQQHNHVHINKQHTKTTQTTPTINIFLHTRLTIE